MKLTYPARIAIVFLIFLIFLASMTIRVYQNAIQKDLTKILLDEGSLVQGFLQTELDKFPLDSGDGIQKKLKEIVPEIPSLSNEFLRDDYASNLSRQHNVSLRFLEWSKGSSFSGISDLTLMDASGKLIGTFDVESLYRDGPALVGGILISPLFTLKGEKNETAREIQKEFVSYKLIHPDSIWVSPGVIKTGKTFRIHFVKSILFHGRRWGYLIADFDIPLFMKNVKQKLSQSFPSLRNMGEIEERIYESENPNGADRGITIVSHGAGNHRVSIVEPFPNSSLFVGFSYTYSLLSFKISGLYQLIIIFGGGLIFTLIVLIISHRLLEPIASLEKTASELADERQMDSHDPESRKGLLKLAFGSLIRDVLFISSHFLKKNKREKLGESLIHVVDNFERTIDQHLNPSVPFNEFEVAQGIQSSLVPHSFPTIPGYEIWGTIQPAILVGGDFFDIIRLDDHRWSLMIGDVSGHGLTGSLFMSRVQGALRRLILNNEDPLTMMKQMNEFVYQDHSRDKLVTLIYGILDTTKHQFSFMNAGHPSVLRIHPDQLPFPRMDQSRGPALGIRSTWDAELNHFTIEVREAVMFYSDGVNEANNRWGNEFGMEKLQRISSESKDSSLRDWQERIISEVGLHLGDLKQEDDLTFLAIRRVL